MGNADNLPFDILPSIFQHLSRSDLVAAALVSRTFASGALPKLYERITVHLSFIRRIDSVLSPFRTILTRSHLAIHVKHCGAWNCRHELQKCLLTSVYPLTTPIILVPGTITDIGGILHQPWAQHAEFFQELSRAFISFTNLESFAWLCPTNASLPVLIKHLGTFPRLRDVQIHGQNLSRSQARFLTGIKVLSALALEEPSTSLMRVLYNWADRLGEHLTSLTLKKSPDVDALLLENLLRKLPKLQKLHIESCFRVSHHEVLRLLGSLHLEVLYLDIYDQSDVKHSLNSFPLSIKHLTLNFQWHALSTLIPPASTWTTLFSVFSESPLESITIRTSQTDAVALPAGIGTDVVRHWGETLRRLNVVKVSILDSTLKTICAGTKILEQLSVGIPRDTNQFNLFVGALVPCERLHTIVDPWKMPVYSHYQGPSTLAAGHVKGIMREVPSVQKIFSGQRYWAVCVPLVDLLMFLKAEILDSGRGVTTENYWFKFTT